MRKTKARLLRETRYGTTAVANNLVPSPFVQTVMPRDLLSVDNSSLNPHIHPTKIIPYLQKPSFDWPENFSAWETTHEAFELLTTEFLKTLPPYPANKYRGTGIVICGGGVYWAGVYVTVRMIRELGSELPIQVWYMGSRDEYDVRYVELLTPYKVSFVDVDETRKTIPARRMGGFECKLYAVLNSPFEQVLYLDADCYPVRDPSELFLSHPYLSQGALFWPDFTSTRHWTRWACWRMPEPKPDSFLYPPIESGEYYVNKRMLWTTLNLAQFYNEYSDLTYTWDYGDKGMFRPAFYRTQRAFGMFEPEPAWDTHSFLHFDSHHQVAFVHRCRDKFRFGTPTTTAQNSSKPTFTPSLPLEATAFKFFDELKAKLHI